MLSIYQNLTFDCTIVYPHPQQRGTLARLGLPTLAYLRIFNAVEASPNTLATLKLTNLKIH